VDVTFEVAQPGRATSAVAAYDNEPGGQDAGR
jgi:hypothetical protein